MRLERKGLLHELGDEEVQIAHHQRFVARLRPAGEKDVHKRFFHALRVLAVVHGRGLAEGQLLHKAVGACAVETHPVIFPRVVPVGGVGDKLAGLCKEDIALVQMEHGAVHRICALALHDVVNEVMVADAGAPCIAALTALLAAVEDGKLHIVGKMLLERLLVSLEHTIGSFFIMTHRTL